MVKSEFDHKMIDEAEDFREEQRRLQDEEDQSQHISNFAGLRDSTSFPLTWDARLNVSRMCIDSATCPEELESLGLDVLKDELSKLGMKCGGTLKERAERLWQSRGISDMPLFLKEHPELVPGRDKEKRSRCTRNLL
jgi:hypothetical protein